MGSGVKLFGGCLVVLRVGELGVSQVIAALVLLLQAVGQQHQQEDGTQKAHYSASDHG